MLTRLHRLVAEPGITIEMRAARGVHILRHVTEDERDLALYVDVVVRVVSGTIAFRHSQAVAGENDLTLSVTVLAERKGAEIMVERGVGGSRSFDCDR